MADDRSSDEGKTIVAPNIGLVTKQTVQVGPRWAVIGIFLILFGGMLYLTASFILPVVFALPSSASSGVGSRCPSRSPRSSWFSVLWSA